MGIIMIAFLVIVPAIVFLMRQRLFSFAVMSFRAYFALRDIPGPPSLPLIGCVYQFKLDSFTFQLESWIREYALEHPNANGLVKAWIGPVPITFLLLPDFIKQLLESNTLITKPSQYDIVSSWIGTGLLTSTNEKWHRRRKMLTPTFHFNILKGYIDVFIRQGEIMAECIEKVADTGREVDVFPFIKRCALDVICETAMGTAMNTQTGGNTEYVDAVSRLSQIMWSHQRFPWLWLKPIWYASGIGYEFDRLVKLTNDFTRKVISERQKVLEEERMHEEKVEESSRRRRLVFIDMLLTMQRENALSDEDIREEVDTFMFEGHDTTASGMGFTIWYLGQYPEWQEKVHAEMDEIFGEDFDRSPTEEDLRRMTLLERSIKESLRLMPSVPLLARRLSHDLHLSANFTHPLSIPENVREVKFSCVLPKNMTVVLSPVITHRIPGAWDTPQDFNPDHFLPEKQAARHPYAYFPFSAGPRNCIG